MKLLTLVLFGTIELLFLAGQDAKGCDPATQAAFNAALYNGNGFAPTNFVQTQVDPNYGGCCGNSAMVSSFAASYSMPMATFAVPFRASYGCGSRVGIPFRSNVYSAGFAAPASFGYGSSFNVNARRIRNSNFGVGGFSSFGAAPVGFGGGTVNINARRIRNSNFGGIAGAAAASGANVNINARRIRRSNF